MSLFGKRNREVVAGNAAAVIGKAGDNLNRQQMRFAAYLNGKTARLSDKSKIVFLVIVCLLFGGLSLYFLINAFH
jgi:hypothetical protein